MREFDKATQMFQTSVDINPQSPWAHFRLGWVSVRNGHKVKGIGHLRESLKIDPNNVDVLTKLGEVLMREAEGLDEAQQYLEKAISIDQNQPDALVALGKVYEKKNDLQKAIECYEKAIELPVQNINAYFYLGIIYEKKKDYKKSMEYFKKCLRIDKE